MCGVQSNARVRHESKSQCGMQSNARVRRETQSVRRAKTTLVFGSEKQKSVWRAKQRSCSAGNAVSVACKATLVFGVKAKVSVACKSTLVFGVKSSQCACKTTV